MNNDDWDSMDCEPPYRSQWQGREWFVLFVAMLLIAGLFGLAMWPILY